MNPTIVFLTGYILYTLFIDLTTVDKRQTLLNLFSQIIVISILFNIIPLTIFSLFCKIIYIIISKPNNILSEIGTEILALSLLLTFYSIIILLISLLLNMIEYLVNSFYY